MLIDPREWAQIQALVENDLRDCIKQYVEETQRGTEHGNKMEANC